MDHGARQHGATMGEKSMREDVRFDEERAVKVYDFGRGCAMEDVEFHDDGVELGFVELQSDFLKSRRLSVKLEMKQMRRNWRTFIAMWTLVGLCSTFLTVP